MQQKSEIDFANIPVQKADEEHDVNSSKMKVNGALPTKARIDDIFLRMTRQLDYLNRTANMLNTRLDYLQMDIDELFRVNVE